jgi:hypothetical protein
MCVLTVVVEVHASLLLLPLLPSLLSLVDVPLVLVRDPIIMVAQAACLMPPFGLIY